jgi:type II secretory pathway pseudopilin PulG
MGRFDKQRSRSCHAFTRLELAVVLACVCLLGLIVMPMLGRSHNAASESVCMNNLRNLGRALLIYSDQNRGLVPEEGDLTKTTVNSGNGDAWYNLAVQPEFPSYVSLYSSHNYPVPGNGSVYSCPAAPVPPPGQPSLAWAYFMYGENNWLCVNKGSRAGGAQQTRIPTLPRPSVTILLAENDDDYATSSAYPALSGTHGKFAVARHDSACLMVMIDGSVRGFRTNEFMHDDSSPGHEWYANLNDTNGGFTAYPCYWWPTPTTPQ